MSTLPLRMLPLLLLLAGAGALTACSRDEAPAPAGADSAASSTDDGFITRTTPVSYTHLTLPTKRIV